MSKQRVKQEIGKWEQETASYTANDFERLYEIWVHNQFEKLPNNLQKQFFESTDQWLLYTYGFLQNMNTQIEAQNRIIQVGRTYDESIEKVEDLRVLSIEKLNYLADQQIAKNRVYSFVQGGVTGTGGWLLLSIDFPLILALNLRTVQLIGASYGYNMHNPLEMILALKVFHAGVLPKRMQYQAWNNLKQEANNVNEIMNNDRQLTDKSWLEQPIQNIFKTLVIVLFRKKLFQGVPLVSVAIGATVNYKLAKEVSEFAKRFYQYRFLLEQKNH
ncbi:EcsC family protein [Halalkalibacillus halophilus]|uniref:EcsC family protein n=1 Tax=Halalkalibacillus halophilus TaxID=392827 RepID=UPI000427F3DD|nr:EcsC family protein [Halalkalibacillus halophilus]